MKRTKLISALTAAAMVGVVAMPVYAAPQTATGTTNITYTANSASPDQADWLVSFPKKAVVSDYNTSAANGVTLKFELLDKLTSAPYAGARTVTVSAKGYSTNGIDMTGGTGNVKLGLANSARTELQGTAYDVGTMKAAGGNSGNITNGYAYLKTPDPSAKGTFSANVTFTFADDMN